MKADLSVGGDAPVDLIHVVVDGFVHGLDPVFHKHLPVELPGLVDTGQPLDFFNEAHGLFLRDELGGLYAVHQQLQLRQFKIPSGHIAAAVSSPSRLHQVQSIGAQGLQVVVDAFALGGDAPFPQFLNELCHSDRVVFIGITQKIVHNI